MWQIDGQSIMEENDQLKAEIKELKETLKKVLGSLYLSSWESDCGYVGYEASILDREDYCFIEELQQMFERK